MINSYQITNISSMATAKPVLPVSDISTIPSSPLPIPPEEEPSEFPFTASPGEHGVSPTNPLVNQVDYLEAQSSTRGRATKAVESGENGHATGTSSVPQVSHLPPVVTSANVSPSPPLDSRQKSVQFAPGASAYIQTESPSERRGSTSQQHVEDLETPRAGTPTREGYGARFISKLKTLSSPISHSAQKDQEDSDREGPSTMDDADAEESAPELGFSPSSMRQRVRNRLSYREDKRRHTTMDLDSLEQSPHGIRFHFHRTSSDYPDGEIPNLPSTRSPSHSRSPSSSAVNFARPRFGTRNTTMSGIPESQRGALSEDEGRLSLGLRDRPRKHRRRISQLTSEFLHLDRSETSPQIETGIPHISKTQKLKQLKARSANLNPFKSGNKKKVVPEAKDARSTQLIASLASGTRPALMVAASTQRDTHGYKRLPILFELLKFRIIRVISGGNSKSKTDWTKLDFFIELSYGEKNRQMTWIIHRSWSELWELHIALASRGRLGNLRRGTPPPSLPRFPKKAVPYLRGWRGLYEEGEKPSGMGLMDEPPEFTAGTATPTADETADEGISPMGRPVPRHRPSAMQRIQRTASVFNPENLSRWGRELRSSIVPEARKKSEQFAENAKDPIEKYLQSLFQVILRGGDANRHNRLCRFLELSAIGIRLIPQLDYHGKEGYLWVKSISGVNLRENLKNFLRLNGYPRKWFFVRESYIACVEFPNSTNISDVLLFDPSFRIETKETGKWNHQSDETAEGAAMADDEDDVEGKAISAVPDQSDRDLKRKGTHQLTIINTERLVKLLSSKRTIKQFSNSIFNALSTCSWAKTHRFKSFAPIRHNCWAMPLIDGEEYMWKVSTAIDKAKHTIFIHDWWLSPEIYLRRPAACSQEWRIDRLLKRKADEGVKIYIILYRNVESAFNLASERTKELLCLASSNIFIQRSPHAGEQKNFLYAHHEKVVVVDYLTAFCGGIDLCFGRWDTPEHRVADNTLTGFEPGDYPRNYDYCQLWPGKDYNNPRVHDFERVEWAYEETYDRSKVPRMPWHDIGIQLAGAPARDLCRHFIQRWNFLRRRPGGEGTHHEKMRPVLLPCPDFTDRELRTMGLTGTCEVQILRSAGPWSLGLGETERSVQDAYLSAIKESQHLVYIENQFFVTSRPDLKIYNEIGDALVERAVRAHTNGEKWKAILMIPLIPGFAFQPKDWGATSLRMIMDMQFWSICRDGKSIYEKLNDLGIRGEDYIQFYSLRSWGEIDNRGTLVTEQLYIHAKTMIVDDRIVIIGSANINDRSMLGKRDSEICVVVQDRARVLGTMAGRPYKKGHFAYDLRMRLMSEHLGIDYTPGQLEGMLERAAVNTTSGEETDSRYKNFHNWESIVSPLSEKQPIQKEKDTVKEESSNFANLPPLPDTDDADIGGPSSSSHITDENLLSLYPEFSQLSFPTPTESDISDPLTESFRRCWDNVASNNTALFRAVFHCQPDSLVLTADQYSDFDEAAALFAAHQHDTERPVMPPRRTQAWRTVNEGLSESPTILLREEAGEVLKKMQGHLVDWPRDWMKLTDWRKLADRIAPTAMFS